eukprot:TRINITY_DN15846_c0_g1_i1.p1 TRINITY_DN15846_c0_g1~~TRINITY_DN15846_c0_g1_i1.p1  ORF type:complete len:425 (+),score=122.54 TRINITY_DN15846_c0_g1_i1:45-1277(+)
MPKSYCSAGSCKRFTYKHEGTSMWYCWQHLSFMTDDDDKGNAKPSPPCEDGVCMVCKGKSHRDKLVLCEEMDCRKSTHIYCLDPKLPFVPLEPWYCAVHCNGRGNVTLEEILPEPGTKLMVLMNSELVWWPAVVVPCDAGYLPPVLPRKGGALNKKRTFKQKTKTNKITTDPTQRPTIVAAYYGQPFGTSSEFTVVKLDWDKIKKLDFSSPYFASPPPALHAALELAKRFDLDLRNNKVLTYKPCAAVAPNTEEDPQTAFMLHLMSNSINLKQYCDERNIKFNTVRKWLCRGRIDGSNETRKTLAVVYAEVGRVYEAAGEKRKEVCMACPSQGSTPKVSSPKRKRPRLSDTMENVLGPSPPLEVTFGITEHMLSEWAAGDTKMPKQARQYVEGVVRHIVGWEVGFDKLPA